MQRNSNPRSGRNVRSGRSATRPCLAALFLTAALGGPPGRAQHVPPIPGAAELAQAPSFAASERVVATHYFYWYKWPDEHFFDDPRTRSHDIQRCHFPDPEVVSYESVAWHRKQMEDVLAAGIDVVLPVYWGVPNHYDKPDVRFSVRGLPPLVRALDELAAQGRTPPRVGLFYDTTTLLGVHAHAGERRGNVDLRSDEGKRIFYQTIRDFFCQIPPRHWACLDGRPIVALYGSSFAAGHDASLLDAVYDWFARDFAGRKPFVIAGPSWQFRADASTGWGAALDGPILGEHAAQVGPGYDDSPVPGRGTPTRDRLDGGFYAASWLLAIQHHPRIVIIETWSELHEGTPICETLEDGRRYIELTRLFADRFKSGWSPASDDWADALRRTLNARHSNPWGREFAGEPAIRAGDAGDGRFEERGVRLVRDVADGACTVETRDGVAFARTQRGASDARYLYFDLADPWYFDHRGTLTVRITYLDQGRGEFRLQYDSAEPIGPLGGAYRDAEPIRRENTGPWRTVSVKLPAARCANRQNGGADFRLATPGEDLSIARVEIVRGAGRSDE